MVQNARRKGEKTARKQQAIQDSLEERKRRSDASESAGAAMQAGARRYPEPPFPAQHQRKPGSEAELDPKPLYDAPYYAGSGKLQDKAAIVTGADSGIGRSVATLFAREGADVAVVYLSEHGDAEETRRAVEREGRRCILVAGDVSEESFCGHAVDAALDAFGRLDVLVNNAAFQLHAPALDDLSPVHFDETLKTNLYGLYYMCRAGTPHMKPGSSIVNCGSSTALEGSEELLDYSMTKGGIHAFTRSLAAQLIARGIRVNAVAPGPVWTPLKPSDQGAEAISEFGAHTPMRRPAQPEEIAPAFVFLASPQCSSYITGEILPVIGGYGG